LGVCGQPEGDCCYPPHVAAQAFTRKRDAAFLVPAVIAYVAEHPECSTRSVYRGVTAGTQEKRCITIELAVSQGSIFQERVRASWSGWWLGCVVCRSPSNGTLTGASTVCGLTGRSGPNGGPGRCRTRLVPVRSGT